MVTQNPLTQARKLKLRWFITLSTLPFLAVLSAFGIIPQSEINFPFNENVIDEISLPHASQETDTQGVFWRTERIQRGDTIAEVLRRLNVDDQAASNYLRSNKASSTLPHFATNKDIQAETQADGSLLSLRYLSNNGNQVIIEKNGDNFTTRTVSPQIEKRIFMRTGDINSTLYAATDAAGMPDAVANQLADIFSGDIDFHRDLRKGDKFSVIYEMNYSNGEPVSTSNILAAEFINQGRQYRALYFEMTKNIGNYFSPDGKSMRKAFLRSPLEFSRISSGFKPSRFHPVLNKWRAHKGVDYAASTGTKVKVTADGTVDFVGKQGGYGNVVIVNHQGRYTTVYGHLSRFSSGLHRGQRVTQGEIIAYVGRTGLATGPHLHYEFKINGQHHDPLRVALPDARPINAVQKAQFQAATANLNNRLTMLSGNQLAKLN
ncbi:MAG: peptidase M23 [Gallionellales bacterium 35-53-114]|jgi:murein DD-endopeptidase MepM/ murein hydrolase activator NlpD|nr:MAG: peptidase M23 [Gallionellales bacterium 35-53-114]OYZ64267.1 MAG: peptidase M23 [Gallionellales bacterium 24-53-125]OZB10425.1 MAG: peptidase M23 [Gallionellales bacterium 39-52-133]